MKNIPRIYINERIEIGRNIKISDDILHYLKKVMRTDACLIFNDGDEYNARLVPTLPPKSAISSGPGDSWFLIPVSKTNRPDPSNSLTLAFAPIKQARLEEMLSMATQMGVGKLQPVITDRTNEHHIKWDRIKKIIIESAEQSGRNSIPELLPTQKFCEFLQVTSLIFADERMAQTDTNVGAENFPPLRPATVLIGPEGGFSDAEFTALDAAGATGINLGRTILRAETAAVAALAQLLYRPLADT
jgi:16S rRNA (uracil1498-N3)-methyltransferase